jgi:GNAT superfamily N-acetyltransferase
VPPACRAACRLGRHGTLRSDEEPIDVIEADERLLVTVTRLTRTEDELSTPAGVSIRRLDSLDDGQVEGLASLLIDCVDGDASASFMYPLAPEAARAFWRGVADGVASGDRAILIAEDAHGIVGTVQLILAQPENQPHRADLAKMLVHRRARRRGLGAALIAAAEQMGRDCGKTLLVLDTETGSDAERLYARMGWIRVGEIPDYALRPRGGLVPTTIFYRVL